MDAPAKCRSDEIQETIERLRRPYLHTHSKLPEPQTIHPLSVVLPIALIIASYILPLHRKDTPPVVRYAMFALLAGVCLHPLLSTRPSTTWDAQGDLGLGGVLMVFLFMGLDSILLTDVQREFKKDTRGDSASSPRSGPPSKAKSKTVVSLAPVPVVRRVWWALELFMSPRGVGWAHAPSFLKERAARLHNKTTADGGGAYGRWRFVAGRVAWIVACIALEQGCVRLGWVNPALGSGVPPEMARICRPGDAVGRKLGRFGVLGHVSVWDCGFMWGVLGTLCFALSAFARLQILHCLVSGVVVAGWDADVGGWPSLFGDPREAWSVQIFWRETWHQLMRRPLTRATGYIVDHAFPSESNSSPKTAQVKRLTRLFLGFFFSGIIHGAGELMMLRGQRSDRLAFGAMVFFQLQAGAIVAEQIVLCRGFGGREKNRVGGGVGSVGPGRIRSVLGYVWVWLWLGWSWSVSNLS